MSADALPYEDLVWCCSNLCELLEVENEALDRFDAQTVQDLAENKAALVRIYLQAVIPMAEDPSLSEALDSEQKEELVALGTRLKELVEMNARRLKAQMEATNMVVEAMVNAAKNNATDTTIYSEDGTFIQKRGSEKYSLSFDDQL